MLEFIFIPKQYRQRHRIMSELSIYTFKNGAGSTLTFDELLPLTNIDKDGLLRHMIILESKKYIKRSDNEYRLEMIGQENVLSRSILTEGIQVRGAIVNNFGSVIFQTLTLLIAVYAIFKSNSEQETAKIKTELDSIKIEVSNMQELHLAQFHNLHNTALSQTIPLNDSMSSDSILEKK